MYKIYTKQVYGGFLQNMFMCFYSFFSYIVCFLFFLDKDVESNMIFF